jgi:hypothetical protein
MMCEGARTKFRVLYSINPAEVETVVDTDSEPERENVLRWWSRRPDGTRGKDMGTARRLK